MLRVIILCASFLAGCSTQPETPPQTNAAAVTTAATTQNADGSTHAPIATARASSDSVWPPAKEQQIPIWPRIVPDMDSVRHEPESITRTGDANGVAGRSYTFIEHVDIPTMTVFRPTGRNTGAAVVVFPGGGFEGLAIDLEGTEVCDWLTTKGVTCVVLKYRVPRSNDYYDRSCKCHRTPKVLRSLQDAQRTIKLIRAKATALGIDRQKIGVIGFSAGGYLVAQTSNIFASTYTPVDGVDSLSSRPDFAMAIYPGHIWRPPGFRIDPGLHVTKQTPPTFLLQAWDDHVDGVNQTLVYAHALESAGVATEVHLFTKGGHAFGLRPTERAVTRWPALAEAWLREIGVL